MIVPIEFVLGGHKSTSQVTNLAAVQSFDLKSNPISIVRPKPQPNAPSGAANSAESAPGN
jgi:hypothetical protein